jgi:ribosomal protein L37AE/L43A
MPQSPRTRSEQLSSGQPYTPTTDAQRIEWFLRPYRHHGVDLSIKGSHAVADCPFCGREGKWSVEVATGLWRCFVCAEGTDKGGGNAMVFLRLIHDIAVKSTDDAFREAVSTNRRLSNPGTVSSWGVCRSPIDRSWLVPAYGIDGSLHQLYKRFFIKGKWLLLPTPGVWPDGKAHGLHLPAGDFKPKRTAIVICEGPWDGMALWECHPEVWGDANIVAVPGCKTWQDDWSELCRGKHVTILFDSDHPRTHVGRTFRDGYDGVRRLAFKLSGIASSIRWLKWGTDGYDPDRPSGWDIRDELSGMPGLPLLMVDRRHRLSEITKKVEDILPEWNVPQPSTNGKAHGRGIEPQECTRFIDCEAAWKVAMEWRPVMSDALSVLLAVCASTNQAGNQLFLQLIGSAGSGKTTMCDGLLVSRHCHPLEHLTGFHSGWRKPGGDGKDCSLITRINGKTLITPEADILVSSPRFTEIMGQQRRIFDGKSGATYKNNDEDNFYDGLRTPWIMAGTPALMDHDQSHLGDRFLRLIINDPDENEKKAILRSALRSEKVAMCASSNGTAGSIVDPNTRYAHAVTGGYVNWLRAHVEEKLALVSISTDDEDRCIDLAELSADLRARPNEDKRKKETHDCKELPTRLARQYVRLANCLAVVLNKNSVDKEVMRIVRKVALDTSTGHSLNVVQWLCSKDPKSEDDKTYQEEGGLTVGTLGVWLNMTEERALKYLLFLRKIGVADLRQVKFTNGLWVLTDRVMNLYCRIMSD